MREGGHAMEKKNWECKNWEEMEWPFGEGFNDEYDDIHEWSGYSKYADVCISDHEWKVKHFIVMKELLDELVSDEMVSDEMVLDELVAEKRAAEKKAAEAA